LILQRPVVQAERRAWHRRTGDDLTFSHVSLLQGSRKGRRVHRFGRQGRHCRFPDSYPFHGLGSSPDYGGWKRGWCPKGIRRVRDSSHPREFTFRTRSSLRAELTSPSFSLSQETPLISKHIADLVNFFLTGGETKSYDDDVRCMSLNALLWTIR